MRTLTAQDARFEPLAGEVFEVDSVPERTFVAVALSVGIEENLCNICAFQENKEVCKRIVCYKDGRQDKRRVIIAEKKPFPWELK